jgi:hypothetical protein
LYHEPARGAREWANISPVFHTGVDSSTGGQVVLSCATEFPKPEGYLETFPEHLKRIWNRFHEYFVISQLFLSKFSVILDVWTVDMTLSVC